MKWFKHDSNANMDAKLKKVRIKYGMKGYGLYWYCLELVASNIDSSNLTFELEHDSEIISSDTGIHYEQVQEMMAYMINLGLFEESGGTITCLKMARRLDQSMTGSSEFRKIISEINCHDTVMTRHDNPMIKNRIEKNRIGGKQKAFSPPSLKEIKTYCLSRNNEIDPEQFLNFYQSKNWMVGKNKMKDWKAAIITWEKRNSSNSNEKYGAGAI